MGNVKSYRGLEVFLTEERHKTYSGTITSEPDSTGHVRVAWRKWKDQLLHETLPLKYLEIIEDHAEYRRRLPARFRDPEVDESLEKYGNRPLYPEG